jgi:trimeric autotransporter adhesin
MKKVDFIHHFRPVILEASRVDSVVPGGRMTRRSFLQILFCLGLGLGLLAGQPGQAQPASTRPPTAPAPQAAQVLGLERWSKDFQLGVQFAADPGNTRVRALVKNGADLYVGGRFTLAGGLPSLHIARWNEDQKSWQPVSAGAGFSGCAGDACVTEVRALVISGSTLYVGGNFTSIDGVAVHSIARYGLTSHVWSDMGGGVTWSTGSPQAVVYALSVLNDVLYAGGSFNRAGVGVANNIASWVGEAWHSLVPLGEIGNGTDGTIYALRNWVDSHGSSRLAVGGAFSIPAANIVAWNPVQHWEAVGSPNLNGAVYAITGPGMSDTLYVGGDFSVPAHFVARLSAGSWGELGPGLNGAVNALALDEDTGRLFAAGAFHAAGTTGLSHIGLWNGLAWYAMGSGLDGDGLVLLRSGNWVYTGGQFVNSGGYPASRLARWGMELTFLAFLRK